MRSGQKFRGLCRGRRLRPQVRRADTRRHFLARRRAPDHCRALPRPAHGVPSRRNGRTAKRGDGPYELEGTEPMLKLSEILVSRKDIETFPELQHAVMDAARTGERFFRMDVKPPYPDTPEDWEDRLEAAFSGLIR